MSEKVYGTELATAAIKYFKFEDLSEFQNLLFKTLVKLCLDELKTSGKNADLLSKNTKDFVFTKEEQGTLEYKILEISDSWSNDIEGVFRNSIKDRTDLTDRITGRVTYDSFYQLIYNFIGESYGWSFGEFDEYN